MKKILALIFLALSITSFAQVGIGTASPAPSAMLDIQSTSYGLLPPRMTVAQLNSIVNPAPGLMVFCTDFNGTSGCLVIFNNTQWECLSGGVALTTPVAIAASVIECNSFSANWNPVSGATGYYLDVSNNSGFTTFVTGFNNLNVGGSTSHTVTGLSSGTTYFFRVRAYNGSQTTVSSNVITVTTTSIQSAPNAKNATNLSATGFTANWDAVSGASSYRLDVSSASDFSTFVNGYNNFSTGNVTSHTVTVPSSGIYYYRVRSESACGVSGNSNTITVHAMDATCGLSITYGTIQEAGYTWHDRNLGASRVATSKTDYLAYGWLYQWGREPDGHQCMTWTSSTAATFSYSTTSTRCTSGICGNPLFVVSASNLDWSTPSVNDLWNGSAKGANDPCPGGFRVPSQSELTALTGEFNPTGVNGAFAADVKLPINGYRSNTSGALDQNGEGFYWTSTYGSGSNAIQLHNMNPEGSVFVPANRSFGIAVRCIAQ